MWDQTSVESQTTAGIGRSVTIKGEVLGAEDLAIEGRVDGRITLGGHTLTIRPGAAIQAELKAQAILIGGAVTGNVTAMDRIEVRETGSVDGDIKAPRLAVREGAILRGRIEAGGVPAKSAALLPRAV